MKRVMLLGLWILVAILACKPSTNGGDGDSDADSDVSVECTADAITCADEGEVMQRCNESGDGWAEVRECEGETPECIEDHGCVLCYPGNGECDGAVPLTCSPDGSSWERGEECDIAAGQQCMSGFCTDPCAAVAESSSYVGCEYWAVDLPNSESESGISPASANFAVVVSNGHDLATATAQVFANGDDDTPILSVNIPPNDLRVLEINPTISSEETSISGTGVHEGRAFHIVTNLPVTAYQFNPLNNTEAAFSNDASLLLPINGLDTDYIVATGDGMIGGDSVNPEITYDWGAFITVVATQDDTEVTIEPVLPIQGGGDIEGGADPVTVTLNAFDVLNVESVATDAGNPTPGNGNLSGSYVRSSAPVAVFSGNVATIMPYGPDGTCCADHLEEQMIPLSAWGTQFVVARGLGRRHPGDWEPEFFRVTGGNPQEGQDVINLTYRPAPPEGAPTELSQGESFEFSSVDDFIIEGDGPLMVTSYFVSSFFAAPEIDAQDPTSLHPCFTQPNCSVLNYAAVCVTGFLGGSCMPIGDPSMIVIPPVEQFRDSYVFLAPNDYAHDAITIIGPMGSAVSLDGALVDAMTLIGEIDGVNYGVVRMEVPDGTHRLTADGAEVGLIVYGMDKDVSYGYPGGLDLEVINII